jgi:hypothetical protein
MNSLELSGKNLEFPTEDALREFLLLSAGQFHTLTSMPYTEIGKRALNDPAFLSQIRQGRNFRVRTFESFMAWLDSNWPGCAITPPKEKRDARNKPRKR